MIEQIRNSFREGNSWIGIGKKIERRIDFEMRKTVRDRVLYELCHMVWNEIVWDHCLKGRDKFYD